MDNEDLDYYGYMVYCFEKLSQESKILLFKYVFGYLDSPLPNYFVRRGFNYQSCKSPIEEQFAVAFDIRLAHLGFPYSEVFMLKPQEKIIAGGNAYYADFLVEAKSSEGIHCDRDFKLVIECDGHDFHEKTKEQVEKRNNRDIDLKEAGYDVLHFSGHQIFQDPIKCVDKTLVYLHKMVGEVKVE